MSTHINAPQGSIADVVLLPGDPLRAKFIAETFLENPVCYNEVRGMYGFTGTYKGKKVSVQGTGMGQPSISIYAQELFQFYNVKKAIRVGTAGSFSENVPCRSVVLANGASTDSALQTQRFGFNHYAPVPSFNLLYNAYQKAKENNLNVIVGPCFSGDRFYDKQDFWKFWKQYGIVCVDMEAAELYTLAAEFNREALTILTISNNFETGEETTAEERQLSFTNMIKLALETAITD